MSQVEVQYCTSLLLSCRCDLPQPVRLCVTASKVAEHACDPYSEHEQTWEYSYIDATLNSYCKRGCSSTGVPTYLYTFEYDDEQLVPDTEITADDIVGVLCVDCLVSYIDDKFGDEPYIRTESDGSLVFISNHGCEYPLPNAGIDDLLLFAAGDASILVNSTDGDDEYSLCIAPASEASEDRGAFICLYGNEHPTSGGQAIITAGNTGTGNITLRGVGAQTIEFETNNLPRWRVYTDGNLIQHGTNGGDVVFNRVAGTVRQGTSDGSDAHSLELAGGGAATGGRGAFIILRGNELSAGLATISSGDSGGTIADILLDSTGAINFRLATTTGWRIGTAFALIGMRTDNIIRTNTSDGSDNGSITISGGGNSADTTRGAYAGLYGNEHGTFGGSVRLVAGDPGTLILYPQGGGTGGGTRKFTFAASTDTAHTLLFGDSSTDGQTLLIGPLADGAVEDRSVYLASSATAVAAGGAFIFLRSQAGGGSIDVTCGTSGAVHLYINGRSQRLVQFAAASDTDFYLGFGNAGVTADQQFSVRARTADGSDSGILILTGAGSGATSRGSFIQLRANEYSSNPGLLNLQGGDTATGNVRLNAPNASAAIQFQTVSLTRWSVDGSGHFTQDITNGGDIVFAVTSAVIRHSTSDGSDNRFVRVSGGGSTGFTRGGEITVYGNEHASSPGYVHIVPGNVAGGILLLQTVGAQPIIISTNGVSRWTFDDSGYLSQDGTFGQSILFNRNDTGVQNTLSTGLTATGSAIGDALQLSKVFNDVTTVAAATGVKLSDSFRIGMTGYVVNRGANALLLYPPNGASTINGGAGGAAVSIAVGATAIATKVAANTWVAAEAPAA